MNVIYIDESGDLGMSQKGSDYFIVAAVRMDEATDKEYCRILKKVRNKCLGKKVKKISEIKFSNSNTLIRKRVLEEVVKLDLDIYALIIEKKFTQQRLKDNLPVLYNYLIKILLEKVLSDVKLNKKLLVCLDRCMSQAQRKNFEEYLNTAFLNIFSDLPEVSIIHECSSGNEGLMATDFVCGAFGYKYNTAKLKGEANEYVSVIKKKITIEKNDFFKKK
jgi:hypothetical protein